MKLEKIELLKFRIAYMHDELSGEIVDFVINGELFKGSAFKKEFIRQCKKAYEKLSIS